MIQADYAVEELPPQGSDTLEVLTSGLETAEARYRQLVEQVPVIIYEWGVSSDIHHVTETYVSPQIEVILGFSAEEWMADPTLWFTRVDTEDLERVLDETTRCIEEAVPLKLEYRMLAKDGRSVWLRDEAVVLERDPQGRATLIRGVQLDITAQKQVEDAGRKSAEEKAQLIQLLAHELFTPITSIQGAALTLGSYGDRLNTADLRTLADGVTSSATRLRRLVLNLDTAAKLDREDVIVSREFVPIGDVLTRVLEDFAAESETSSIRLIANPQLALREAVADPSLAVQALGVVIENALDYSGDEPVDIELLEGTDGLEIRVSDRGPGVPPEQRDQIFDLFTQVDSSDSRSHEGLGVGLFLARRIMQLQDGDLDYAPRRGGGSTFTCHFRAAAPR
jgi:PAS domain S-box-containing protein